VCLEILDHGNDQLAELGRNADRSASPFHTFVARSWACDSSFLDEILALRVEAAFWSLLMGKTNGPELRVTRKQLIESRDYSKNSQ